MSEPADRILIADDESNLRKLLGALLRREGYAVQLAADGEEALEAFEQERFSVVITDLRMPHMDGMTLLKRLLEKDADLPVIVITAHGTVDTAVEALKIGAFDFITKPYDKDELTRVVAKAVHTRRLNLQASRP
ncbi:MAG: sigma-54-dependent Fis family transcriptional regulator, partial [Myxococcales bacterium]|nr:sigma-54-dependent Fis family transcriptional regulator [Myxococcales bacterium]